MPAPVVPFPFGQASTITTSTNYMTQQSPLTRPSTKPVDVQNSYTLQRRMTDSNLDGRYSSANPVNFHDSPLSVRDDFTNWLFDDYSTLPAGNPGGFGFMSTLDSFGNQIYPNFFDDAGLDSMFQQVSPQSNAEAGTALSTASTSEFGFSDAKRLEVLTFMETRFHEDDYSESDKLRDEMLRGDYDQADHMLSLASMHRYVKSYWRYFHDQIPLLHRPSFNADDIQVQLLLAIMVIGAAHIQDDRAQDAHKFTRFVARHLRWQIFRHPDSRPAAKLWVFQTLLLLEVFEKLMSTRTLHERSNVHCSTTITLMRRGTALVDDHEEEKGQRMTSPDQWWKRWTQTESTRRAAFAAFLLDAYCSVMFGHASVMSVHEIRIPLPCDDALWSATSAAEVGRVETTLHANGVKPPTFTEALKRILTGRKVRTNAFGRTILMAGLLSVTWHMQERDLQMNVLGMMGNASGRLPNNWKEPLEKAFDFWKRDFDDSNAHMQQASLPWQHQRQKTIQTGVKDNATILHHLSHMSIHVDFRDCQMLSGAKSIAARPVTDSDRAAGRARISAWVNSAGGRDAILHSLQVLRDTMLKQDHHGARQYFSSNDHLLLRPWTLYNAALIVFSWGYMVDGVLRPFPAHLLRSQHSAASWAQEWEASDQVKNACTQDAQLYLSKIGAVASVQELERIKAGRNNVVGLLRTLEFAFQDSKWELLQEAAARMKGAVQMLEG